MNTVYRNFYENLFRNKFLLGHRLERNIRFRFSTVVWCLPVTVVQFELKSSQTADDRYCF